jgi:hypothetical protein
LLVFNGQLKLQVVKVGRQVSPFAVNRLEELEGLMDFLLRRIAEQQAVVKQVDGTTIGSVGRFEFRRVGQVFGKVAERS